MLPPVDPSRLLSSGDITQSIVASYYAAYTAYAGAIVGSATASVAGGCGDESVAEPTSEVSIGSSASSGRAAKRSRWRRNRKVRGIVDGAPSSAVSFTVGEQQEKDLGARCYAKLLRNPVGTSGPTTVTFAELLAMQRDSVVADEELDSLGICRTGKGVYHVTDGVGVPARTALAGVALANSRVCLPGSLAEALMRAPPSSDGLPPISPLVTDVLGMSSGALVEERIRRVTHVAVVDVPDPENFAMLADLALQPGVYLAVVLVGRPVNVRAIGFGGQFSAIESTIRALGVSDIDVARIMLWQGGADMHREVTSQLPSFVRGYFDQSAEGDPLDRPLYRDASIYRMQEYLSTAGVDLDRVLLLDSTYVHAPVISVAAHPDDYCMSMSQRNWLEYSVCAERVSYDFFATGKSERLNELVEYRRKELRRLSRGKIVFPRVGFNQFVARASERQVVLLAGGPLSPVPPLLEAGVVREIFAMAAVRDRARMFFPEQFDILADYGAFRRTMALAESSGVAVSLLTVDVSESLFARDAGQLQVIRDRHGCGKLFDRWGVTVGKPLFNYDVVRLCELMSIDDRTVWQYVDLVFGEGECKVLDVQQRTNVRVLVARSLE